MYMLTKRTNILFDEKLWNLLVSHAYRQKTSVGELVRTAALKAYGNDSTQNHRKRICDTIRSIRKKQKQKVNYKALINYGRKYI